MSLVAYGSSDESSDEEVISNQESEVSVKKTYENVEIKQTLNIVEVKEESQVTEVERTPEILTVKPRAHISLPTPKTDLQPKISDENDENNSVSPSSNGSEVGKINFNFLPKPKKVENVENSIEDDDDYIPPTKDTEIPFQKPAKEKAPVKISIAALSDFKDLDEEKEKSGNKVKPSQKGTGLFAVLPPPRSEALLKSKPMVPRVLTKKPADLKVPPNPQQQKVIESKKMRAMSIHDKKDQKSSLASNDDSSSEDEENDKTPAMDFFSLTSSEEIQVPAIPMTDIVSETLKYSKPQFSDSQMTNSMETSTSEGQEPETEISEKILVSNVMNLPREEIIKKNKAEVGPKLPVPEQDYNVDSTGNVVFDEKAIEYLCGKRGVKRKNKEFEGVDIIEISGEDIKPDEREWLVKALTEEPVTRPVSSQGAGPSGQSKKKHQITYLAHQAKAMEVELKNKWAQNKMTRQQTQSKYGF